MWPVTGSKHRSAEHSGHVHNRMPLTLIFSRYEGQRWQDSKESQKVRFVLPRDWFYQSSHASHGPGYKYESGLKFKSRSSTAVNSSPARSCQVSQVDGEFIWSGLSRIMQVLCEKNGRVTVDIDSGALFRCALLIAQIFGRTCKPQSFTSLHARWHLRRLMIQDIACLCWIKCI